MMEFSSVGITQNILSGAKHLYLIHLLFSKHILQGAIR